MPKREDKNTPIPEKIAAARREAVAVTELRTDVTWIKKAIEEGHACLNEQRLVALEGDLGNVGKRIDWARNTAVALALAVLGVLVTLLVNCDQAAQRDASVRVHVEQNTKNIGELQKTIKQSNEARAEDTQEIIRAVHQLHTETKQDSADEWWETLPPAYKNVIKRHVPPTALPH